VAGVYFADRARSALADLPDDTQQEVRRRLRDAARWPEMYPLVADRPRWQRHRKIVVRRQWLVLYRVVPLPNAAGEQIYVTDIVPARSDY
jgi:hypothetical protein